jgi:hypothetical protein
VTARRAERAGALRSPPIGDDTADSCRTIRSPASRNDFVVLGSLNANSRG